MRASSNGSVRGSMRKGQTQLSVCFKEGEAVLVKLKRGLERQALKPQSIIDLKERLSME